MLHYIHVKLRPYRVFWKVCMLPPCQSRNSQEIPVPGDSCRLAVGLEKGPYADHTQMFTHDHHNMRSRESWKLTRGAGPRMTLPSPLY